MTVFRRWNSAERGATAAEFAIIVPALLLLVFGIIEFGQVIWSNMVLQQTAIQTARCMGVLQSQCASGGAYSATGSLSYAQTVAAGYGLTLTSSNVTLSNSATCAGLSGFSQANVTYQFTTAVPFIKALASGVPLSASACFPNQG